MLKQHATHSSRKSADVPCTTSSVLAMCRQQCALMICCSKISTAKEFGGCHLWIQSVQQQSGLWAALLTTEFDEQALLRPDLGKIQVCALHDMVHLTNRHCRCESCPYLAACRHFRDRIASKRISVSVHCKVRVPGTAPQQATGRVSLVMGAESCRFRSKRIAGVF